MFGSPIVFLRLIEQFLTNELTANEFLQEYMDRWREQRDKWYESVRSGDRRPDVELQQEHLEGKISLEELSEKWSELFGLDDRTSAIQSDIDRMFTSLDRYCADPAEIDRKAGEITEEELRREAKQILATLREAIATIRGDSFEGPDRVS